MRSRHQASFETFEANTSDAWDDSDDDLIKLASAARQKSVKSTCGTPLTDTVKLSAGSVGTAEILSPSVSSSGIVHDCLYLVPIVKDSISFIIHCPTNSLIFAIQLMIIDHLGGDLL